MDGAALPARYIHEKTDNGLFMENILRHGHGIFSTGYITNGS
jgi:hypothetical protein